MPYRSCPAAFATVGVFRGADRHDTNVTANAVFEAARSALKWFRSAPGKAR